jgi:hypothetical protein
MRLAATAFGLLLLSVSPGWAQLVQPHDAYIEALDRECRETWGNDLQMVEFCYGQEFDAMEAVIRIQAQIADSPALVVILQECLRDWREGEGYEWTMVEFCYGQDDTITRPTK